MAPEPEARTEPLPIGALRGTDFRALYRKLEDALTAIERSENTSRTLEAILATLLEKFRNDLGFEAGRLYKREGEDFFLCRAFGVSARAPAGVRVPRDYPPHQKTLEDGLLIMRAGDAGYDAVFERTVGVDSTFAAIAVGEGSTHVIAFSIDGEVDEERVLYSLSAVRHVINLKLEHQKFTGMIEESRAIQESMLPAGPPSFEGYDIDGRSRPAERVGGDLFDYLPLSSRCLGVAVADASGHGLPAALLARDAITGLRMGISEDVKIARVVERLNQVIHRAALARKFVSLFYGELATDGTLTYCNAGHSPPLLSRPGACLDLEMGDPVLGPIPSAVYHARQERLAPGDVLLLFTDGLVDCEDRAGRQLGTERLRRLLGDVSGTSARGMVDSIFAAVDLHTEGAPQRDDITVVAIRRVG